MQWAQARCVPGNEPCQVEDALVGDSMSLIFSECTKFGLPRLDAERLARTDGFVCLHDAAHDFDPQTTTEKFYDYAARRLRDAAKAAVAEIAAVSRTTGTSFGAANLGTWALQREDYQNIASLSVGSSSEQADQFDAWARAARFSGKDHAALLRSVTVIAAERVMWLARDSQFKWNGFERPRTVTLEQEGMRVLLQLLNNFELQPGDSLEDHTDGPVLNAMQVVYERLFRNQFGPDVICPLSDAVTHIAETEPPVGTAPDASA